ncbi:uncharacterized protein LOC130744451 [Lotus japonicus]|uniref:uncharacterized protein LOC130744451 n=1 Tax=Lotus japonicus TaxID=34305 RepID=UPI002589D3B1|nr:uncharacterized protein LOC130744451 [Lotus japonicus]
MAANVAGARRPTAGGMVYAISGTEADEDDDLAFAKRLKIDVSKLPFDLIVSVPASKCLVAKTACLECPWTNLDKKFVANLICLPLKGLDVIISMDWLSHHHVLLDCTNKVVIFPDAGLAEFLNSYFSNLSLKEGALRSLLTTTVVDTKANGVQETEVVRDFEDVFPEDVPGIPQSET